MAPGGKSIFSFSLANPYDKNHAFRLIGSLAAFILSAVTSSVLVFYHSPARVQSRWGMLLVVPVEGWTCSWFQLKTKLCDFAGSDTVFSQFEWRALFEEAYGEVPRTALCEKTRQMVTMATVCAIVPVVAAMIALGLVLATRLRGSPEIRAKDHYSHCFTSMIVVGVCMGAMIVAPTVFHINLPKFIFVKATPLLMREGIYIAVVSGLLLAPVIFGYHVDRSVVKGMMEFENLVWNQAMDEATSRRVQMMSDIDRLEEAKFGGLVSPTELAKQTAGAEGPQSRVDRYLLEHGGPWR